MQDKRRAINFTLAVILPALTVCTLTAERFGVVSRLLGLDLVQAVEGRFQQSYGSKPSAPLYRGDPAWAPTLELIEKYSAVKLLPNRQPEMIARFRATLATEDAGGYQWTSPSTPIAVLYGKWPINPQTRIPNRDATIVGTIGQLQTWITRREAEVHFLINDVILGGISILLGYLLWRADDRSNKEVKPKTASRGSN